MRPLAALALLTALAPALASAEVLLERVQASGYTLEEQSFAARCTIEDTGQAGAKSADSFAPMLRLLPPETAQSTKS